MTQIISLFLNELYYFIRTRRKEDDWAVRLRRGIYLCRAGSNHQDIRSNKLSGHGKHEGGFSARADKTDYVPAMDIEGPRDGTYVLPFPQYFLYGMLPLDRGE